MQFIRRKAPVLYKRKLASGIYLIRIEAPSIAESASPGQFIHINIPGKPLRRPISIYSRSTGVIDIAFKVRGDGTAFLSLIKKGEFLDIIGPVGNTYPLLPGRPLFIAGGIGAAPLNFLASHIETAGVFICGTKTEYEHIPLRDVKIVGHEIVRISESRSRQLVTDLLPLYIENSDIVYAAGPAPMLKITAEVCAEYNKKCYISWEERMGCGIGLCQGCVIKTLSGFVRTCTEGPVFDADEVLWDEL